MKSSQNSVELNEELRRSFLSYAMSTILGRALPDVRDGLKPVHRRVLFAMYKLGLLPDTSFRKSARIVGEVLGKFHPHGDSSVYDALVRMAQDFVFRSPLIRGQGNFGSVDGDPPAAMRYTEAKLSPLCYDILLADLEEDTVDFIANFDGNEEEPLVLPARLPLLLINGASGIAVGMATHMPPHNLGEVVDALVSYVRHRDDPTFTEEQLRAHLPAPDFPTGGVILGTEGASLLYQKGSGSIAMRAVSHEEMLSTASGRSRQAIIITELPYLTNKATLLEKIARLVNEKAIEGISDLQHLLQINTGDTEPHLQSSAMAFYSLGETEKGLKHIAQCLQSDPDSKACMKLRRREKNLEKDLKKVRTYFE
ncbi:hypothetical protein EON64_15070, partial [archaeon]